MSLTARAQPRAYTWAGPDLAGHIPALDGVRGLAIVLVVVNNLYPGYPSGYVDRLWQIASNAGWTGVDLFFVLSGFLITGILLDTKTRAGYFRNFYTRRVLRIFPLYYGFLALWLLIAPALGRTPEAVASLRQNQVWYWTYLANVKIALHGWGDGLEPGGFWSLAVEEQFYLVWPLVVLLTSRRRLIQLCLGLMVAALALRIGWRLADGSHAAADALYVLTPARMDTLALGSLLAAIAREPAGLARLRRWARPVAASAAAVLAALFVWRRGLAASDAVVQTAGYSVIALCAGSGLILAITAAPGSLGAMLMTHPILAAFGRYSYGIYVWQHLVRAIAWPLPIVRHPPKVLGFEFPAAMLELVLLAGAATVLGALSWHLFERHILRLKDRFR